jgi:hypothetical protein
MCFAHVRQRDHDQACGAGQLKAERRTHLSSGFCIVCSTTQSRGSPSISTGVCGSSQSETVIECGHPAQSTNPTSRLVVFANGVDIRSATQPRCAWQLRSGDDRTGSHCAKFINVNVGHCYGCHLPVCEPALTSTSRSTGGEMSIHDIDWDEEFGHRKPAIPRPPCKYCGECESQANCIGCGDPLCEWCLDLHFEGHDDAWLKELV